MGTIAQKVNTWKELTERRSEQGSRRKRSRRKEVLEDGSGRLISLMTLRCDCNGDWKMLFGYSSMEGIGDQGKSCFGSVTEMGTKL